MARLLQTLILFGMYFCAASTAAQAIGLGTLYWHGGLTRDKLRQYAAVLYGLDLPTPAAMDDAQPEVAPPPSRSARLAALAEQHPLGEQRKLVFARERTEVDQYRGNVQARQRALDLLKKNLDSAVTALEAEAEAAAFAERLQTLESLQPVQTKTVFLRMLNDKAIAEQQALAEVADILQALSTDKLKKILAEFKSDTERATLHRILAHIGQFHAPPVEEPPP